jgi:hypothetical protein
LTVLFILQSIERHQMEVPIASFGAAARQLRVLQMDNVRLTAQVRPAACYIIFYITVCRTSTALGVANGRRPPAAGEPCASHSPGKTSSMLHWLILKSSSTAAQKMRVLQVDHVFCSPLECAVYKHT